MYSVTIQNTTENREALKEMGINVQNIYPSINWLGVSIYNRTATLTYGFTKDRPRVDIDTLAEILLINDVKASLLHMEAKGLLTREDMKEMVILEHHHPYPEDAKG